jgi:hypothetical protein
MVRFGISYVKSSGSVDRELVSWSVGWLDLREIGCEDGRWLKLA